MERSEIRTASITVVLALLWSGASEGSIRVYWGQNGNEASLADTCASGNFAIVLLSFLTTFGDGQTPVLNLAGHCDPSSGGCQSLGADIKSCQSRGVKVFLSLGGASGSYAAATVDDTRNVTTYLWNNFLGGQSDSRPLGDAVLDGIDFDIVATTDLWENLAKAVSALSTPDKKVYLSAAPECPYPDAHLGNALQTGLFDYVWIQFYNNPSCQYADGDASDLVNSWNQWTTSITTVQTEGFFLGLPASSAAAGSGFIPTDALITKVLPQVRASPNYGGVMLWSKYYDEQTGYSSAIVEAVRQPNKLYALYLKIIIID
ncbi:hypothetical protein SUGI_0383270 [Cryptomeria japonica]|uniref:acidic endochitinase-like n=1 Tax=Cryptomeria japonica TaxID=3369 RepID=UPI002408DA92|nr:acidic endochitinase-like [Cryptomeria japonica]GLJ20972.1 hypothetical protein SUGI_0383270 [Cryptomeria japonica]